LEIVTERVEIPLEGGGTMGGYLARPTSGGPHPGVVVFMEIFGINGHIRDVVERVAREGYVTLAPDYFHRTGPGIELGYDDDGFARGMALLNQLKANEMVGDARAAVAFLRGRDDVSGRVGAMGFCIGGHMTFLAAAEADVDAAASFYGGGIVADPGPGGQPSTVSRAGGIRGRLLCLFGGQDALIPAEHVATIRKALEEAGASHEIVVYDEADHGFFCDQRGTHHEASARDAWERVKRLFADELR
jgi:carboxymethylenebutenolidase